MATMPAATRDEMRRDSLPGTLLVVVHDFIARSADELSLTKGDRVELIERDDDFGDGWFLGRHTTNGSTGLFPEVYTTPAPKVAAQRTSASALRRTSGSMPHAVQAQEAASSAQDQRQHRTTAASTSDSLYQRPASATTASSILKPSQDTTHLRSSLPAASDDKTLGLAASTQSPVMHETLTVIDEHMNALNTRPLRANGSKRDTMSSTYSSQMLQRMSYIVGHETDEEEHHLHTEEEVLAWSPHRVAEYLEDHGVEKSHCQVFTEQEISGEVMLAMDQSSVFLKEFDLGSVGRRLRTWHKIKALQDEVRANSTSATSDSAAAGGALEDEAEASAVNRSRTASAASSALPRALAPTRSNTMQPNSQASKSTTSLNPRATSGTSPLQPTNATKIPGSTYRPSAQSIRSMNHSRRHSSIDSTGQSIDATSLRTGHRKQPSADRHSLVGQSPRHSHYRHSKTPSHGHIPSYETTPILNPEAVFGIPSASSTVDVDKGYFSSTEAESRSHSKLNKKQSPVTTQSRSATFLNNFGRRSTPAGRVTSTASGLDTPVSPIDSAHSSTIANIGGNARVTSMPTHRSKPMGTMRESAHPVVTKLDYSDPPSAKNATRSPSAQTGSEASSTVNTPSSSTAALSFFSKSSKPTGLRATSDAVTKQEKSAANAIGIPATVTEGELISSPTKDGADTPSTEAQSLELKPGGRTSSGSANNMVPQTPSTAPKRPKPRTKKSTSAYTRGLEKKTPAEQMANCDYSGWMKKKSGSLMTTWKPRLFVLKGRRLSYYYSESDTEEKGLIDISFHNVMPAHNDKLTGLHATVMGAAGSPTSPRDTLNATTAQQDLKENPPLPGSEDETLFIFKLTPPKAGRGVNFTKPTVHYFAVNSKQEGRLWMAALMKAVIDREQDGVVTTTYNQQTISLAKARARRERPPALQDEEANGGVEVNGSDGFTHEHGLGIGGIPANPNRLSLGAGLGKDDKLYLFEDGSSLAPSTVPTIATSVATSVEHEPEKAELP